MRKLLLLIVALMASSVLFGQTRYIDEIFSGVMTTEDVMYGANIAVLTGAPALDTMYMDVYTPMGDTATNRPLVIIAPTGNFLPPIFNGGPFGDKRDSANVGLAMRLAKRGYVVASFNYRLGWNPSPTATDEVRRSTILQAAYRGIQDAKNVIRYFRWSAAEDGNPYGFDGDNVAVGGLGTGGYISLGATFLDQESELLLPKFIDATTSQPYVVPAVFGNFDGTDTTQLNVANFPSYSSDFTMAFHMGGALGDSSWVDGGEVPLISFHSPQDEFAPYEVGNVIVPTTGDIVIGSAAGGGTLMPLVNGYGNNDIWVNAGFTDDITKAANEDNGGNEGFFPVIVEGPGDDVQCDPDGAITQGGYNSAPWTWWNETWFEQAWDFVGGQPGSPYSGAEANCVNKAGSPNDPVAAKIYLDSVAAYMAPRMALLLANTVSINDVLKAEVKVYPNPAQNVVTVQGGQLRLTGVTLLDMSGRVLRRVEAQQNEIRIQRENLPSGLYILQIRAGEAMTTQKVRFD